MLRSISTLAVVLSVFSGAATAGELAAKPEQVRPILLGSTMPDATLITEDGKPTTLKDQVGGKPAILVFYRGGWCPFCNKHLSDLRLIQKDVEKLGYQMIAITPDLPANFAETRTKDQLDMKVLSDNKADAMIAFGIGFKLSDELFAKYKGFGVDLEKRTGETNHALPVPALFIIDAEGVVQFSYVHPDYKVRVPASVVLEAAKVIAEGKEHVQPAKRK